MNQPQQPPPSILEKYLNQCCTDHEREWVEAWYASLDGKVDYIDSLPQAEANELKQATFAHIQNEINPEAKPLARSIVLRWIVGIAASLIVIAGFYPYTSRYLFQHTASVTPSISNQKEKEILFKNNEPRIVTHLLPDGTTVWLHSDAAISYPKKFIGKQREVTFRGEGFFEVAHDRKHPFIVKSGDLKIRVLGTKFNVKAVDRQRIFEVSVVSGSVAVSAADEKSVSKQVILKPREQVFFETNSKRLTTSAFPDKVKQEIYEPITITFEGTELRNVIQQLDKRFDIQIHLENAGMASCRLTADFEEQPLPVILDMLCTSLEATYAMSGKSILIQGAGCN